MNIQDVQSEPRPEGDMLELIFKHQASLMEKYHHIEISQGVGYGILGDRSFNINEIRSQCLVKDFAWRVTEEITEATECVDTDAEHFHEEMADALHFLTELCITVEIGPSDIVPDSCQGVRHKDRLKTLEDMTPHLINSEIKKYFGEYPKTSADPYTPIQSLGIAMNCLKQKPWKQTHVLTDTRKFRACIMKTYWDLIDYWTWFGVGAVGVFDYYFRKNKVNQFRQNSKY